MLKGSEFISLDHHRWYLKTRVRILIVVDGSIQLDNVDFGLGRVIDTLQNQSFYGNAEFIITGATRAGVMGVHPVATSHQFKFTGFRFNMAGFNINNYDQIWFFGIDPGNDGSSNDANIDASPNALKTAAEIAILADWMNAHKGGVLAIGDHHYLGASLCHNIPRIRKMRKWTNADHVPSIAGHDRKDTNQYHIVAGEIPFNAQSDSIPQPIEVLKKRYHQSIFSVRALPHPVLCGAGGVIDILPDHPHEGEVLGTRYDTNTGGSPVNLTGNYPAALPEFPDRLSGFGKPEPQIIALGHPHNYPEHDKNQAANTQNPSHSNDTSPFGLISVYDGAEAGVGRAATDSTWHHWFNINLTGFDAATYTRIQNYYTNMAVWLCNDTLRHRMLGTWVWTYLIREFDPMHFSVQDSIWRLGINAKDVLGRTASQCTATEWILIYLPPLREKFKLPDLKGPCLTCPPPEIFEIAILGGIMKEFVPLVEKYRITERSERKFIDSHEIGEAVSRGIKNGHNELLKTFRESLARTEELFKISADALKIGDAKDFAPEINTLKLKIQLDSVMFNSPIFAQLLHGKESFLAARVSNQFLTINKEPVVLYLEGIENIKSASGLPGLHFKTNFTIIEDSFQDGETLTIELFLNDKLYQPENKFFELTLQGDVETWIGSHRPPMDDLIQNKAMLGVWINISQ